MAMGRWLGLALGLTLAWTSASTAQEPAEAARERVFLVATRKVAPGPYDVALPVKLGLFEASEHRVLAFDVPGRLEWTAVEGTAVAEGEPVARLESTLQEARARQAELRLRDARSEVTRIRGLRAKQAASAKALENAEIQLALRESELAVAREELRRRTLHAPFAGLVTENLMDPGEVTGAANPVATLMELDPLHLEVGVPGYQVSEVRPGARVHVEVPSLRGLRTEGVVDRVADAAAEGRHLFRVEIHVPNPDGRLRAGMAARAWIVTDRLESALPVPQALAVARGGRRVVFFADGDRAREVPVDQSRIHADHYLLEGPLPSQELVVRGQRDLREGARLRIDGSVLRGLDTGGAAAEQPEGPGTDR